jgi:hypothetical protein
VVIGSPTISHFQGKDGSVIVGLNWPIVAGGSRQARSTTTFTYGASAIIVAADSYFTPPLKDLVCPGLFYNISIRGVAVIADTVGVDGIYYLKVPDFYTASDNPKWGYLAIPGPYWTGTSGASAFLSAVNNIIYSCDAARWKYNLVRLAVTRVTG